MRSKEYINNNNKKNEIIRQIPFISKKKRYVYLREKMCVLFPFARGSTDRHRMISHQI